MLKKLSLVELIKAVQERVEVNTGLKCYDEVLMDTEAPFYYVEYVRAEPSNTKTMWCETHLVYVHAIAEKGPGRTKIYKMIQQLEEALTEEITIPDEYSLVLQTSQGTLAIKTDPSNEKHSINAFSFKVSYGFKTKI